MRKALLAAVLMIAASGLWAQAQQTVIVTAPQVVVVNPASACPGGNCPQYYQVPGRGGYSSSSWNIPGLGGVSRYQSQNRYQQSVNINGLFRSSITVTPRGVTQSFSIPGLLNTRRAFFR
jgi:hypothetical protein